MWAWLDRGKIKDRRLKAVRGRLVNGRMRSHIEKCGWGAGGLWDKKNS